MLCVGLDDEEDDEADPAGAAASNDPLRVLSSMPIVNGMQPSINGNGPSHRKRGGAVHETSTPKVKKRKLSAHAL